MTKKILFLIIFSTISIALKAQKECYCKVINQISDHPGAIIEYLKTTDLDFTETVINEKIETVREATYFYCSDENGYLYIKLDDREKLFKDVPLDVWFEFKFQEEMDTYYKSQIKYTYIAV